LSLIKSFQGYRNFLQLKKNNTRKIIYFYSESKNYRNHFEDILNELSNQNKYQIFYFSSDLNDTEVFNSKVKPIYIGNGIMRMIFFTFLSGDLMIMTLSDLGNHEIKRSKNCKNYLYLFHSLCSTFKSYTKNAFDNYDFIFANGDHQINEIRKTEEIYNLKKKEIINIGYPYLENLKKKISNKVIDNRVIFAPSWSNSKDDLLENYGLQIIEILLRNFKVFFRPHHHSITKSKKTIREIENKFKKNKNFTLNQDITELKPFDESSLLLTDNGGICMEYYTLYKRPFICIDYKEKIHNREYKKISEVSVEEEFKNIFSEKINIYSLDKLNSKIEDTITSFKFNSKKLDNFFQSYNIKFDDTTKKACEKIEKILF